MQEGGHPPFFPPLHPRTEILKDFSVDKASDKQAVKRLRAVLVEDQFSLNANLAHLVLDASSYGSRGQLWLASVAATSRAEVLEAAGISHIYSAGYQKQQTRDKRFTFFPTHDGTGVVAGDVSFSNVLQQLHSICDLVLRGYRVVLCCKNGAHRSAMMMALLLMLMTGRGPGDVSNYLVRLRTIVDMNSPPPRRRELGSGLAFLEEKQDVIRQFRQKARVPVLSLNEIVSRRGFRSFLAAGSLQDSTSQLSGFQPVLPPPSTVQLTPAASSVKLTLVRMPTRPTLRCVQTLSHPS